LLAAERDCTHDHARGALGATLERVDLDLTSVQVDYNRLTSLPPELGSLTNLKWLDVRRLKPTPDGT
jgi:Leucine-rich repeat (LRR) protein